MTQVSKRLPVLLALLVGLAMAFAVWGAAPNAVFADDEKQLETVSFGNGYDAGWAQFFFVAGLNGTVDMNYLNISVFDKGGNLVEPENYDLVISVNEGNEAIAGPYGIRDEVSGFTEYLVDAVAKEESEYVGDAHKEFAVADEHSLEFFCSDNDFSGKVNKHDWRMHDRFWLRQGQDVNLVVKEKAGMPEANVLTEGENYKVTYYRRSGSPEDMNNPDKPFEDILIASEDTMVKDDQGNPAVPTGLGGYFARIEGIAPYYGGNDVLLDIVESDAVLDIFFETRGDNNLWSDQNKDYSVAVPEGIEGELTIEVGFWNPDEEKWGKKFAADAGYYEFNSETSVLTLHGNTIIDEFGAPDFPLTLYATIKNSSDETIASGHEDVWLKEAEYRYDLPDDHLNLLPGWEFQIDKTIHAFVRNAEHPEGKEFDLTAKKFGVYGPIGLLNYTDAGDHRNYKAMKIGHARVFFDYDDYFGVTQTANIYVTVSDTVYNVDVWSENGVYKGLPGSSLTLRANARKETMTDNGEPSPVDWEYNCNSDGLRYEWELVSNEYATINPDGDTAVLKFKDMPSDRDQIDEGVQVKVSVYEENKEEPVIVRDDNWYQVASGFDQIYPTQIYSGLGVGKSITIKPEVRHFELGQSGYSVVDNDFDVEYDLNSYDGNAISIDENDGVFTVERKGNWDTNFRIEARWDNGRGWTDQWYHFDDKNYRLEFDPDFVDIYDDSTFTLEPRIANEEELEDRDYEIRYTARFWDKDANDWGEEFDINNTDFLELQGNALFIDGVKMDAAGVREFSVHARLVINDEEYEDNWCYVNLRESCVKRGHDHIWIKGVIKKATLTEVGYEYWICPDFMFLNGCGEMKLVEIPKLINIAGAAVKVNNPTYTGAALTPALTVTCGGKTLAAGADYAAAYSNNTNAGAASVTITGKGKYGGTKKATFNIVKAANPMVVKTKVIKLKANNVKKKKQTIKAKTAFVVKNNQGKLTYKKKKGNAKITIAKNGNITVKKGLKKGKSC